MKYEEMCAMAKKHSIIARLPHWKPDVWISSRFKPLLGDENIKIVTFTYDDGEPFEPTYIEKLSGKWEVIGGSHTVIDQMLKDYEFARLTTLKTLSMRFTHKLQMLNSRLTEFYLKNDCFVHEGKGYIIVMDNVGYQVIPTSNHAIQPLVRTNDKNIALQAMVTYGHLLDDIRKVSEDLKRVRFQELEVEKLIELFYEYK